MEILCSCIAIGGWVYSAAVLAGRDVTEFGLDKAFWRGVKVSVFALLCYSLPYVLEMI